LGKRTWYLLTLKFAKAMLDDWQNDTCVGKYLKTIFEIL
jgi:hypothetical protein